MQKKILVAPLNWGLGHATRCIPIIRSLILHDFEPIIASDGAALELLRQEFPKLTNLQLPSYNIKYAKKRNLFKLKLLTDSPKVLAAIRKEKQVILQIINEHQISGIISDNRFGAYCKDMHCVFLTHQLQVLSGNTTWISSKMHQIMMNKFDEIWVPDNEGVPNLSGKLGHPNRPNLSVKYIGPLSRFKKKELEFRYDIMILLSGPEPQRSMLEKKLLTEFNNYVGRLLFVRGIIDDIQTINQHGNLTIRNYLLGSELEMAINESKWIVCRSGYTTIMDLAKLGKKAFFIPTPGQYEQEYLAKLFTEKGMVPSCTQDEFTIEKLTRIDDYKGLETLGWEENFEKLFQLFKGERKFTTHT